VLADPTTLPPRRGNIHKRNAQAEKPKKGRNKPQAGRGVKGLSLWETPRRAGPGRQGLMIPPSIGLSVLYSTGRASLRPYCPPTCRLCEPALQDSCTYTTYVCNTRLGTPKSRAVLRLRSTRPHPSGNGVGHCPHCNKMQVISKSKAVHYYVRILTSYVRSSSGKSHHLPRICPLLPPRLASFGET
jgi:hypothetical protein